MVSSGSTNKGQKIHPQSPSALPWRSQAPMQIRPILTGADFCHPAVPTEAANSQGTPQKLFPLFMRPVLFSVLPHPGIRTPRWGWLKQKGLYYQIFWSGVRQSVSRLNNCMTVTIGSVNSIHKNGYPSLEAPSRQTLLSYSWPELAHVHT